MAAKDWRGIRYTERLPLVVERVPSLPTSERSTLNGRSTRARHPEAVRDGTMVNVQAFAFVDIIRA
jgi:hypothetical protein